MLFVVIFSSKSFAATYYVAGDNSGDDTRTSAQAQSTSTPWKTIQNAANIMIAGDTVNVKGGITYSAHNACTSIATEYAVICIKTSGNSGNYITYQAWPETGIPKIQLSGNTGNGFGVLGGNKSYIVISGFELFGNGISDNAGLIYLPRFTNSNYIIKNNILHDSSRGVFLLIGGSNNKIINNTFYNISDVAIYADSVINLIIQNNIIYGSNVGIQIVSATVTSDYNVLNSNTLNYDGTTAGSNDIFSNPLFVNSGIGDFSINANSPAVNSGIDLTSIGVTLDILGRARPNAGAFDIGAYEDPNLYVDGNVGVGAIGNDSNTGSLNSPFLTIQRAADVSSPGDIVNVKGNITYNTGVLPTCTTDSGNISAILCVQNAGTVINPITYRAWIGTGIPVIDASNVNRGISPKVGNLVIEGFQIINPAMNDDFMNNAGCVRNSGVISGSLILKNSILVNCREAPVRIFSNAEVRIENNTIVYNIEPNYNPSIDLIAGTSGTFKNNLIYTKDQIVDVSFMISIVNSENLYFAQNNTYSGIPNNILNLNPIFINFASGDYRITKISPAVNAGANLSSSGVTKDIRGISRAQGSAYDIGAYEYYDIPVALNSYSTNYLNNSTPTFTGYSSTIAGANVTSLEYRLDGGSWGTSGLTGTTIFSLTMPTPLADGNHTLEFKSTDSNGNSTDPSIYGTAHFNNYTGFQITTQGGLSVFTIQSNLQIGGEGAVVASGHPAVTMLKIGNFPVSSLVVDLSQDRDWSLVGADIDLVNGRSFVSNLNPTLAPGASSTHSLYVPKLLDQTSVFVCPQATSLSEVTVLCPGGYNLTQGSANLRVETVGGVDYWVVDGLSGTGALGLSQFGTELTITPNNSAVNGAQDVVLSYGTLTGFAALDKVRFTFESTGLALVNGLTNTCSTPTVDANVDTVVDGSGSVAGNVYEYTFSNSNVTGPSTVSFCVHVTASNTPGSYAVSLTDDNGSFGAAMYYVGGDNQVFVRANVAPSLSFNIRNIDDTADTNSCNFGTVSSSTTIPNYDGVIDAGSGECGYSLAVGTNAVGGYQTQIQADGQLNNADASIADLSNGGTYTAGVEAYGFANISPSTKGRNSGTGEYTEPVVMSGNFALALNTGTSIPTSITQFMSYNNGVQYNASVDATDVTKVVHGLVVGSGTPAGYYDQVITYTTTASF